MTTKITRSLLDTGITDTSTGTVVTLTDTGATFSSNLTVGGTTVGSAGSVNVSVGDPGVTVGGVQLWSTTGGNHYLQFGDGAAGDAYRGAVGYKHATDDLVFYAGGTEKVTISSTGAATFSGDVASSQAAAGDVQFKIENTTNGAASAARIDIGGGQAASARALTLLQFSPTYSGNIFGDPAANTSAIIDNTATSGGLYIGTSGAGAPIKFATSTVKMTLDTSGNLLVGTTDTSATTGVGLKLRPDGDGTDWPRLDIVTTATTAVQSAPIAIYSTGAAAYRFYVGANGDIYATNTTITAISDQRYKENIRDLDDGLSKIMALQPRRFDWKEGKGRDVKDDRGWIAQEIEQVFPDLVDEWQDPAPEGEEPYKSVRPDLIPVLVKAMQEQQAMIADLQDQVVALSA